MGQYKGKREYSRPENEENRFTRRDVAKSRKTCDDPFAGEKISFGERLENFFMDVGWFFRSRKGKTLVTVLCTLLVIVAGLRVGEYYLRKNWIKPPEVPVVTPSEDTDDPIDNSGENTGEDDPGEQGPTDDELYPDDGYAGSMPTVSGERKNGVYTFLLVGTDMDDGNTDTIMVASYDTVRQQISIMSIPRDTMINESWDLKKINSVYSRTGNSINSLANRVQKLVGFKPDFYVKVDLSMFVELVDLVGGVEFNVPQDMKYDDPYQDLHIDLKAGVQVLDGEKAMQLVRFRGYAEGDIRRVAVQQDFLKALIKECLNIKHWGKAKAYIELAMENIQTDLDVGSVIWFAANVLGLNEAPMLRISDVYTCTIPGNYWASTWSRATNSNQSYVTIYADKVIKLVNERFNPYEQNVTADMIDAMRILENGDIASSTGVLKDTKHNEVMAVRRGEAYYDEEGNIVYGDPNGENDDEPTIPGGDETGDPDEGEEGGIVTDPENGTQDGENETNTDGDETGDENPGSEEGGDTASDEPSEGEEPSIPDEPTEPNGEGDAQ